MININKLFKARRYPDGEWVEGFLFQLYDENTWCISDEPLSPNDYSELIGHGRDWFIVDESTICRCTELTDKNGKLVWENDIVYARCNGLSGKGVIKFENGCFVLKDEKRGRTYSLFGEWELRVDGNILGDRDLEWV